MKLNFGFRRWVFSLVLLCASFFTSQLLQAQSLPSDAQTLSDAKAAIKTAAVQKASFTSDWKMERESGYNFANLAKRAVKMQVKDNTTGMERRFEGLAIYQRGAPTDKWRFSRFFTYTNSIEIVGKAADTALLYKLTTDAMDAQSGEWFGDETGVFWIHPVTVESESFKQNSNKQMSWNVTFKATQRWDYTYLVTRWYRKKVDAYLGQDGKTWTLDPGNIDEKEIGRKQVEPSKLDKIANVAKKGFWAIYGTPPDWTK